MLLPPAGDDWVALSAEPLPFDPWRRGPSWPAVGQWSFSPGPSGTTPRAARRLSLEYEAYADVAVRTMEAMAPEMRERWPCLGRVALLHRTGLLVPTEVSVVVSVSAPHRPEAFDAARFGIDAIKAGSPIWKRESWEGGSAWGLDVHPLGGARAACLIRAGATR